MDIMLILEKEPWREFIGGNITYLNWARLNESNFAGYINVFIAQSFRKNYLLKKFLMESFIFCGVKILQIYNHFRKVDNYKRITKGQRQIFAKFLLSNFCEELISEMRKRITL